MNDMVFIFIYSYFEIQENMFIVYNKIGVFMQVDVKFV